MVKEEKYTCSKDLKRVNLVLMKDEPNERYWSGCNFNTNRGNNEFELVNTFTSMHGCRDCNKLDACEFKRETPVWFDDGSCIPFKVRDKFINPKTKVISEIIDKIECEILVFKSIEEYGEVISYVTEEDLSEALKDSMYLQRYISI